MNPLTSSAKRNPSRFGNAEGAAIDGPCGDLFPRLHVSIQAQPE